MRIDAPVMKSTAPGGSMIIPRTLLATASASEDATVELSFDGFDKYLIIIQNIRQDDSASDDLHGRLSTDGGLTFSAASEYFWNIGTATSTGGSAQSDEAASADAQMLLSRPTAGTSHGNANNEFLTYEIQIEDAGSGASYPTIRLMAHGVNDSALCMNTFGVAGRKIFKKANAIQLFFALGNIVSGEFRMYGLSV